jgi:hypothetical protein
VTEARAQKVLRWSALLTAAGLGLMLWSIAVPTALPVVLAMSAGQGLGTLAFALFGWVVISDLRGGRQREAAAAAAATAAAAAPPVTKADEAAAASGDKAPEEQA